MVVTPRVGQTWVFRRSTTGGWDTAEGRVDAIRLGRFELMVTRDDRRVGCHMLPFSAGWEPFLCLDEGETQEHPTTGNAERTVDLPPGFREHFGLTGEYVAPLKPKVGERWEFCKDGQDRLWTGTVEGAGKGWVVITGPILLDTDVVKPVRKLAS